MEVRHYRYDRMTMGPEKCMGKPCVRGMHMPVPTILSYLGGGMSIDEVLREWPRLEEEDIRQALAFAGEAMQEEILPLSRAEAA